LPYVQKVIWINIYKVVHNTMVFLKKRYIEGLSHAIRQTYFSQRFP
jgi:hypothetical protein